ncbi:MAG: endonuclease III [Bacteroidota bacterium]
MSKQVEKSPRKSLRKESAEQLRERAVSILKHLKKEFPQPKTALLHENPFQLVIATILSAQCTDERVNMVTPGLFKKYPTPKYFAGSNQEELERDIHSTGFFRMKAKNIIGCSKALLEKYGGKVPQTIEEMVELPGVGRKTANVVLGQAYGIVSGVVVDTHVHRVSQRLGLTVVDTAEKIEEDLMKIYPKKEWIDLGTVLILHGRKTCNARSPKCEVCVLVDLCPSATNFVHSR